MNTYHHLEQWLTGMDELSDKDFVIIDQFLHEAHYLKIREFFKARENEFKSAGIGSGDQNSVNREIRNDRTYWLDRKPDRDVEEFWSLINETVYMFNRYCYLGLSGYEFHFAQYPPIRVPWRYTGVWIIISKNTISTAGIRKLGISSLLSYMLSNWK